MACKTHSGACCNEPTSADIAEVNEACNSPSYLDLGGRGQQRGQTSVFLEGALQGNKQLVEVLEWLAATRVSIQGLKEQSETSEADVTSAWNSNTQNNVEKSLADVDSCIHELDNICRRLFNVEVTKTKKEETALNKSGVWMWWREKKMDAKTIKRIQCLHPPSVEDILKDPCLAMKSSTDLSFMLQDIANSMDLNKPMKTAFKFAELGLQNLNQALQESTKESRRHQAEVKQLMMSDCRFEMAQLKIQFEDSKLKLSAIKEELSSCKGQNLALSSQIKTMQKNCRTTQPQKPLPEVIPQEVEDVWPGQPDTQPLSTRPKLPPLPHKSPCQTAEMAEDMVVVEEEVVHVERHTEKEQYIIDQVEKKSVNLLEDFQNSVFKIIDKCRKGVGIDNKAGDLVQVYSVLKSTIKSSFQHLVHHLDDMVTENIVNLPPLDIELESEYSNNPQTSPGDQLNALSEDLKQQEKSMEEASHTIDDLYRPNQQNVVDMKGQSFRHAVAAVMGQPKNINDKGKKQICKMRITLESMVDVHNKMGIVGDKDMSLAVKKSSRFLLANGPELSPKTSDNKAMEVVKEKMVRGLKTCSKLGHVSRYIKEMAAIAEEQEKEEKAFQGRRRDEIWVLLVDLQRTNLKLLSQAVANGGISAELYKLIKDLIMDALCSIKQRMACLCRRFIDRQALRDLRKQLNARFRRAKDMEDGRSLKRLYSAFQKLETYESKVLGLWCKRLVSIERTRSTCIAQMHYLFWQLRNDYCLELAMPVSCLAYHLLQPSLTVVTKKLHWSLLPITLRLPRQPTGLPQSMRILPLPSLSKPTGSALAFKDPSLQIQRIREIANRQTQAQWETDTPLHSMRLAGNTPVATPAHPCHIPLIQELNVNWGRISAQRTLQDR